MIRAVICKNAWQGGAVSKRVRRQRNTGLAAPNEAGIVL
jgi:hypothetical protein